MAKDKKKRKTAFIGVRVTEKVRDLLQEIADKEYRTLAQQCEKYLIESLKREGYLKDK